MHNRLMSKECIHDVKFWMTNNQLKLGEDKVEALIISAPMISNSIPLPDCVVAGSSTVYFSPSEKYFGVMLDMHLTMTADVVNLIRSTNFELCLINSIHHYLAI